MPVTAASERSVSRSSAARRHQPVKRQRRGRLIVADAECVLFDGREVKPAGKPATVAS